LLQIFWQKGRSIPYATTDCGFLPQMLHTQEVTGSSPAVSTKNHRNLLIPVILFYNPQLFKALNFCRFSKTHNLTHTGKGPESTGQGQTGFFLSGPVFFSASAG